MIDAARKLATIIALDVAGYSARTEADEAKATAEIAALRGVIDEIAAVHGGRVFNTAGDGFMLEFGSCLSAVDAACDLAEKCEPKVRVGVHVGDVLPQPNGDLLGHRVNVAARLMAMAEPGSMLISGDVKRMLHGPIGERFQSCGMLKLDKMAETIEAFGLADTACVRAPPTPYSPPTFPSNTLVANDAANAAKAIAEASLLSLRPWLSCEIELVEPLTFNTEGDAVFGFRFTVKNVGHSPALSVQFSPFISLLESHGRSVAHLKTMADWNRDMGVNATTVLIPSGLNKGPLQIGTTIFPAGSKIFKYRLKIKRSELEKSCEDIRPNTNFSPEVFALVFYTYPSATVRATTAISRTIVKIGGAAELDKPLQLSEMNLDESGCADFAT